MESHSLDFFGALKIQSIGRKFLVRARLMKALRERYEKIWDPKRKKYYYYDRQQDTSSWLKPALLLRNDLSLAPTYTPNQAVAKIQRAFRSFLAKLVVRLKYQDTITSSVDEESGYPYYFNPLTQRTMWELPLFMRGRIDWTRKPLRKSKKSKQKIPDENDDETNGGEEEEDDDSSSSDESDGLSEDSETVRAKRRAKRKYPRSKIQALVDKAEDNVYETFELDLSNLKAPHISSRVYDLHELKTLNISKNRISRINPNIQYLDKLEMLDASYNGIASIPKEIEALIALKDLNLSHNRLEVYPGQLYKLRTLERIDFSYNQFEEIPIETGNLELLQETGEWEIGIGMLTKLRILDFRGCRLKEWSTQLEKLENLEELYLSDNDLSELTPDLPDLKSLRIFHLSGNLFKSLPSELYSLPLEEFRVQFNDLVNLPQCDNLEEVNVPSMRYIDISNNAFEYLDRRLSIFSKLKTLMAQNNHIQTTTADCFITMSSLTYLDLSHNQLPEISASLSTAIQLTHCDLSYNNLTEVPPCFFRGGGRLKILKLDHNMIGEVSGKVMGMLSDLERLEMQYNLIKGPLPTMMFAVRKLVYVDLSHNQIDGIPSDLGNWIRTIHLNLSFNNLSQIPATLGELKELIFLELNNNCLLDIPTTISHLKRLEHFTVHCNRLSASPHILELLPHLHFIDLSWNVDIPPHLLSFEVELVDADAAETSPERKKEAYAPFYHRKRRILRIDRVAHKKKIDDLERRIGILMTQIDDMQAQLRTKERDFIGNKRTAPSSFYTVQSWLHRLHHHFQTDRINAQELQTSLAQKLKDQIDQADFNTALEETLLEIQKYKGNVRDRIFFTNLALNQNRIPRWYASFLDFVKEHSARTSQVESSLEENHADDVLSEVFLGLDAYPILDEICSVLHELNLLSLLEELDADLYHLDTFGDLEDVPPPPAMASDGGQYGSRVNTGSGYESDRRSTGKTSVPITPGQQESRSRQSSFYSVDSGNNTGVDTMARGRTPSSAHLDGALHGIAEVERETNNMRPDSPDQESAPVEDEESISTPNKVKPPLGLKTDQSGDLQPPSSPAPTAKKGFFAGLGSPSPSVPSTPNVTSGRNTASPSQQSKPSRMFFSFTSNSSKTNKNQSGKENNQESEKSQQKVQLKVDSLGINIQTNDLPRVLYLMKHLIDIDVFISYHYSRHKNRGNSNAASSNNDSRNPDTATYNKVSSSTKASFQRVFSGFGANQQTWTELPSMSLNFHYLQEADRRSLKNYLTPTYTIIRENPYGKTLFSLFFEANQVLAKSLITVIDYLTRSIRSMERENDAPLSYIDLANRDHFYQFHTPDENELKERERLREKKKVEEDKRKRGLTLTSETTSKSSIAAEEILDYDPNVTEMEFIEDYGDLLRDVYNALSQDKKLSDKKDKQLSLKDRYKKNVEDFLTAFEDHGGLEEMKHVFENEFKTNASAALTKKSSTTSMDHDDDEDDKSVEGSTSSSAFGANPSRRPSYIMKRPSLNLQESFNTRRTSQGNLRKKLAAWEAAEVEMSKKASQPIPLLGQDKALGASIIAWLADYRKLLSGWLLQCIENNAMILSFRGIDIHNYDTNFLRNFNIIRDQNDPSYQRLMAYNKKANNDDDGDNIVHSGTPSYVTNHLLALTRRHMLVRSRAYQIYGHYAEAMRAYDSTITLHNENLPQAFFINYVKVCLSNGHYFRANMLMERVIRKFIMPKYPEIKEQNRKKAEGKLARKNLARALMGKKTSASDTMANELASEEDELFSDVQMLPVEREIAILTRFAKAQAERLETMNVREEEVHKRSLYPHAFLEAPANEDDMDELEKKAYYAKAPEIRYGRKTTIKEFNARRLEEEKKIEHAQQEEEVRWEILRKCKDTQFRSRVALDAEELLEIYGISMPATTKKPTS